MSSTNTSGVESRDIFNCPICLELLKTPKYLPCLHTFCELCLKTYVSTESNRKATSFQCPVCRKAVPSPEPDLPVEEWASKMPLNYMLSSLMEGPTAKGIISEDKQMCASCSRIEEPCPAKIWCIQCREALCDQCNTFIHKRVKNFDSHQIVPVGEMSKIQIAIPDPEEPCMLHKDEVLKVYCLDHQALCCVLCLALHHRTCDRIKTIAEIAKEVKNTPQIEQMKNSLDEILHQADLLQKAKDDNISCLKEKHLSLKEKVSGVIDGVRAKLDKWQDEFNTASEHLHKQTSTELGEKRDIIEHFQKTVKNGQSMLQVISKHGSDKQVFILTEKLRSQISGHMEELQQAMEDDSRIDMCLELDKVLETMGEKTSVAKVTAAETKNDQVTKALSSAVESFSGCLFGTPRVMKTSDLADLKVSKLFGIQSTGSVTGGVFFSDGSLLLVHNGNKKLVIYDEMGKVKTELALDYRPWDAAFCETKKKLMVSDVGSSFLRTYNVTSSGNELIESDSIHTPYSVFGIDLLDDRILCAKIGNTDLLNHEGKILKSFSSKRHELICASKKENKIFYGSGNNVTCMSLEGDEIYTYSHQDLKGPRGMAEDGFGNLFVCGFSSGNIHVISQDGKQSRIILEQLDRISKPYAIGFDTTGRRFFVTSWDSNEHTEVYELTFE